ncbi:Protein kinase domain, partial [Dillenia turbinata]
LRNSNDSLFYYITATVWFCCRESGKVLRRSHWNSSVYDTSYWLYICHPMQNIRLNQLIITLFAATSVFVIGTVIVLLYVMRKFGLVPLLFCRGSHVETSRHVETFLRNNGSLILRRYSYSEVKKMTNSFKSILGQGGYGSVYKGKLLDDRPVAVKVLSKSKGDGEEFMNEVASIGRTSHVNIVRLLGYCFEGQKRALIYEFMPNGSLEKFIFAEEDLEHPKLGWETLYQIALGIARGLEYLHRGCNTRILHFDIKPHNILLDDDFHPKISDFGLAKLCPQKESIISMSDPRGTIGYIAPEVVCRAIGRVSHKSDVYSYGMMVLEIVGGKKNVNTRADRSSEIYFPNWVYKRVRLCEDPGLRGISNEEDKEKAMKMVLVSLWCIQTDPLNRPTMSEVVDMLQGSLESLQMPPRPYLSSPPRSISNYIPA